jgi:hypothetical protein
MSADMKMNLLTQGDRTEPSGSNQSPQLRLTGVKPTSYFMKQFSMFTTFATVYPPRRASSGSALSR